MVANEIANMLFNNVCGGNGVESFENWCEDGKLFCNDYKNWDCLDGHLTQQDIDDAITLMHEIATDVDKLSFKLENEYD